MEDRSRITRRRFLVLSGGAVAVAAGAGAVTLAGDDEETREAQYELSRQVAAAFEDPDSARAVGRAYKDAESSESAEREIVEALRRSNPAWGRARAADIPRLAQAEVKRDYARGRVVGVDGWYLSRTEARLCALTTFA